MSTSPTPDDLRAVAKFGLSDDQLAALGELQSVHRTGSKALAINIWVPVGFATVIAGVYLSIMLSGWRAAVANPSGSLIGAAVVGLILAAFLIPAGLAARKLRWRLHLFENGFVFDRGTVHVLRWAEVETLVAGGVNENAHLKFDLTDGRHVKLDNSFKDFPAISGAIRESVAEHVLARLDAALARGEQVAFKKMKVSSAGIEQEGKPTLTWKDVKKVSVEWRGNANVIYVAVVIWQRANNELGLSEWAEKQVGQFPNYDAFLALAERYTQVEFDENVLR